MPESLKLQAYLAHAGIASRRKAEELIGQGLVLVNGAKARIGARVTPGVDKVLFKGQEVGVSKDHSYVLIYKPVGLVSTTSDELQRSTVLSILPAELRDQRLYPVGRLDQDSEGLLLLTNDGDVAFRLTHPRFEVPKTYAVKLDRHLTDKAMTHLKRGVELREGMAVPLSVTQITPEFTAITKDKDPGFWLEITIDEGMNHQVRRMMERTGYPVLRLIRLAMGNLNVTMLNGQKVHVLTEAEAQQLQEYVQSLRS